MTLPAPNQRLKNFICALLAFFVGGIGSLTYFDAFLPNHAPHQHPYHISLFEGEAHHHNPLPPSAETLAQQITQRLATGLNGGALLTAHPTQTLGWANFFYSGLSRGYLLSEIWGKLSSNDDLLGRVYYWWLNARSAWLPPPKKPPLHL